MSVAAGSVECAPFFKAAVLCQVSQPLVSKSMGTATQPAPDPDRLEDIKKALNIFDRLFYDASDFTIVLPDIWLGEWWYRYCCDRQGRSAKHEPRWTSFEFQETVATRTARLQASRAFDNNAWTVSVRWDPPENFKKGEPDAKPFSQAFRNRARSILDGEKNTWRPDAKYGFGEQDSTKDPWLFSISDVIDCLHARFNEVKNEKQGLILVTGPTNAAKSKIARGLIWKRLDASINPKTKRRPHLITYEDPIEEYLWDLAELPRDPNRETQPALDYTPRKAEKDCRSLREAVTAALRQTPTVFYIGEARTKADLRRAVSLAAPGTW